MSLTKLTGKRVEAMSSDDYSQYLPKFEKLDRETQRNLARQFWNSDPIARQFRMNLVIRQSMLLAFLINLPFSLIGIPVTLGVMTPWVERKEMYFVACGAFMLLGLISCIVEAVCLIKNSGLKWRQKTLAYEKRFQVWLRKNKGLGYSPLLISLRDKQMYEQVDIHCLK